MRSELNLKEVKDRLEISKNETEKLRDLVYEMEREDRIKNQEKLYPIAQLAHDLLCQYNHTDGCGWGYEKTWDGSEHQRWVSKIEGLLKKINIEKQTEFLEHLQKIIKDNPDFWHILRSLR